MHTDQKYNLDGKSGERRKKKKEECAVIEVSLKPKNHRKGQNPQKGQKKANKMPETSKISMSFLA